MGLCTSKSTINLHPSTHPLSMEQASQAAGGELSIDGTPILDEGILMVQPVKLRAEGTGAKESGGRGLKPGAEVSQTAKVYLEVGVKEQRDGQALTSREVDEEDEDEEGNMVEELINISDSKGSLRSEFLEWATHEM